MSAVLKLVTPAPATPAPAKAPVSLTAPKAIKASAETYGRVHLTWSPVEGAERYLIERRDGSKRFEPVKDQPPEPAFTDKRVFSETIYQYRVRATRKDGSTGPYSTVAKARTLKRASPFRELWMKNFADGDRSKPAASDPDSACQQAALKAAFDLAKAGELPEAAGRGWNIAADVAITAYAELKEKALPRYVPSKGDLDGYLYKMARGYVLNSANEQFNSSGKRDHGRGVPVVVSRETIIHSSAEMRMEPSDGYVPTFLSDAEAAPAAARDHQLQVQADLAMVLEQLPEEERNILWLRHVAGLTLTDIAETLGMSYTTLQRRVEALDAKYPDLCKS